MLAGYPAQERKETYLLEENSIQFSRQFRSNDGRSTVSSNDETVDIGAEADGPFDPVRNGDVVLFSINLPKTCEAFDLPYDRVLQEEAQALSRKKYAAVVDKASFFPQNHWCTCDLILVSQGLPKFREGKLEDSSMCVPIFPETSHPLGRQSVHLKEDKMLPWNHCYQSTVMRTRAVVAATKSEGYSKTTSVTDDRIGDLMGFWRYQIEDKRRSNVLAEALEFDTAGSSDPPGLSTSRPPLYRKYSSTRTMQDSVFGSEEDLRLPATGEVNAWYEYQGIIKMFKTSPRRLHVDVWYDLTSVQTPSDPCDFFEERAEVHRLLQRTQERIKMLPLSAPSARSLVEVDPAWLTLYDNDVDDLSDYSKSDASTPPPDLPLPYYLHRDSAKSKVRNVMKNAVVSLRQAPPRLAAWVKRHGGYHRKLS